MFHAFLGKLLASSRNNRGTASTRKRLGRPRIGVRRLEGRDLPAPLTWAPGVNLPLARAGAVAVQASNQDTVILGGSPGGTTAPTFAAAYPTWQAAISYATSLDQSRYAPGAGVLADGTLLVFGGNDAGGEAQSSGYDFGGNPSAVANMHSPRYELGYATDENHLVYAIGGKTPDGGATSAVEVYNQSTNTWTKLASLPTALEALSAVADGAGHVFAFGGLEGNGHISSTVYRYTIATNKWDTVATLPVATDGSAAVLASNGLIYVLGGVTSSGTTANVESYNESTNTWTSETALPAAVSFEAATVDSLGRIVVAGGSDSNHHATASVYLSQELNQPDTVPTITTTTNPDAAVNVPYGFLVSSTGNPQPTYSLTAAPSGMTIDPNTGMISWTGISSSQVGDQTVTVQASNYNGNVSQTYTVPVIGAPPTGVTATGSSTSSITVSWNASTDAGGVSYNLYEALWHNGSRWHPGYWYYVSVAPGITTTSYTVTGLGGGTTHNYVVTDVGAVTGLETARSGMATASTWFAPTLSTEFLWGGAVFSSPVPVTQTMSVTISLMWTGNPTPAFSIISGPSTISVDANGHVTYTPSLSDLGIVNFTVQATNAVGSTTQSYSFNVLRAPTIVFTEGTLTFNGYAQYATAVAVGSDGVTPVNGTFQFTYVGPSSPPSFAGTYTVTAYFTSSDANYGSITVTGTMIINPAPAVFNKLKSPAIPTGTSSVRLSGYLTNPTVGGPASGTVDITLNGVTHAATLKTGDFFSTKFNTSGLAAGAYPVTYVYVPGDTDFAAQNGASTLYVGAKPVVTTQPTSQTVTAGTSVTFTAAASGDPTPTVQWQVSTNGGATFKNIAGATSTTLTLTTTAGEDSYEYRAVFSNAIGVAKSSAATLTVQYAPIVTINPTSQTVAAGTTVTFTAAASGDPVPTVQWQVSTDGGKTWTDITGATTTTLSFTASAADNSDLYQAVFTNLLGSATTTAAMLTVT
jgi:hypothetical protein